MNWPFATKTTFNRSFISSLNSVFSALKQSVGTWFVTEIKTDVEARRTAYHEKLFVSTIIKTISAFTIGSGFTVSSENKDDAKKLNALVKSLGKNWIQIAQELILFGYTDQKATWSDGVQLESIPPENVTTRPGFLSKNYEIDWSHQENTQNIAVKQLYTPERIETYINGTLDNEHTESNIYGFIPIVKLSQAGLSGEFGYSEISPVLLRLIDLYHEVLNAGANIEKIAGEVTPYLFSDDWGEVKKDREDAKEKTDEEVDFVYAKQGADIGILEAKRGADGAIKLLEVIFWNIVGQSRVPEFCFGTSVTGMNTSQEQSTVFIQYCKGKRIEWEQDIKKLLKMAVLVHNKHCKLADRIPESFDFSIEWPDIIKDNKLSKDILQLLIAGGVISNETAYEVGKMTLPLPDWDTEKGRRSEQTTEEDKAIIEQDRREERNVA